MVRELYRDSAYCEQTQTSKLHIGEHVQLLDGHMATVVATVYPVGMICWQIVT